MTTRVLVKSPPVAQAATNGAATAPTHGQLRRAERLLTLAGFHPGKVDGKPSPALESSLKTYQAAVGLPATGQLDASTLKRLEATGESVQRHHQKHQDGFVSIGQKSGRIEVDEKRLRKLGYDVGKVDGVFDQQLSRAVKAFKADQHDLKNKGGYLGAPGQRVLKRESKALSHAPERRRLAPTRAQVRLDAKTAKAVAQTAADGTQGLVEGSRGAAVKNVQKHLRAAGYDPKATNGVFDERTAGALKAFQARSGLPATGTVDPQTWKALKKSFILSKKPASPMQALGERSSAVKASEKLLRKLGLHPGKVDGLFDRRTQAAVKRYEKQHHLTRDGKIGTAELAKMQKSARSAGFPNRVLSIARRYLGFHEGAGNSNPFSRYFGRGPEAWCADFVSYCYTKAGKKLNQSYTPTLLSQLKANGTWNRSHPRPGDIVMFDWSPGSGDAADHTGLVEKVFRKNGHTYVQTIEGNSSDQVKRNVWMVGDSRVSFGSIR